MRLKAFHRAILLVLAAAAATAALWWKCRHDPAINFLPSDSRAEWILFPAPVQAGAHRIAMLDTVFRKQFQLNNGPTFARLQLRAARRLELKINSKPVDVAASSNWKDIAIVDVLPFLQTGSNTIEARVFNDEAPPALWFQLSADKMQIRSDATWEASLAGSAWRPAASAIEPRYPQPGNLLAGGETISAALPNVWPAWGAFAVAAVLLVLLERRLVAVFSRHSWLRPAVIVGTALAWLVLFWNNTPLLPFHCGYDSTDHVAFIKYIQERRTLPLPTEGYEMFQPPLYYALSAAVLSMFRLSVTDPGSVAVLRTLTMCVGVAHVAIVLFCLRLLFPTRPGAQLAGLLLAASLPMQLYLCQYVTNETLAAALVSAAIYIALRIFKKQDTSIWKYAGLGLCIGAAVLTKATGFLLIPPLFGALLVKMARDRITLGGATRAVAATALSIFVACGWYYIWIWRHFGRPIVGNWERVLGFNWWQDPGFHTAYQYFRFGRALISPLFSGYNSFVDGVYSTLWGDGLGGGLSDMLSRTPWNYDLMISGYWLALIPTLLIALGAAVTTYRFVRRPSPEWFLLIGFSAAVVIALVFMTVRVASYAQIKAFYGLSMLVPLCAFAAVGWEKLARASRFLRLVVAALLLVWALNSFFAVWIRESAVQHVYVGRRLIREHLLDAAVSEAVKAVGREPSNAMAQCFLATVSDEARRSGDAVEHTMRGLQVDAANEYCQIQNAINVAKGGDIEQAMTIAQRLIDFEPENARAYDVWFTCARQLHQTEKAITIGRDAVAISPFDPDLHYRLGLAAGEMGDFSTAAPQFAYALLLQPNRSEIEKKLHLAVVFAAKSASAPGQLAAIAASAPESPALFNELAWVFSTDPDADVRNGVEAVRLSERACALTKRGQAKFVLTLAAAYAEAGRFSEAANAGQEALSLARSAGETPTSAVVEKLLSSLQSNQAYREEPMP